MATTFNYDESKVPAYQLKGKRLEPHVGIMSYTRAWLTFHPESKEVTQSNVTATEKK